MTTWPLYWLNAACWPVSAARVNDGAGPPASAANAVPASNTSAIAVCFRNPGVESCIEISPDIGKKLEERGQSQRGFDVVNVFHATREIGLEHMVSDVQMHGQPVGDEQPVAYPEIDRKLVLFTKFHI